MRTVPRRDGELFPLQSIGVSIRYSVGLMINVALAKSNEDGLQDTVF